MRLISSPIFICSSSLVIKGPSLALRYVFFRGACLPLLLTGNPLLLTGSNACKVASFSEFCKRNRESLQRLPNLLPFGAEGSAGLPNLPNLPFSELGSKSNKKFRVFQAYRCRNWYQSNTPEFIVKRKHSSYIINYLRARMDQNLALSLHRCA